MNEQNQHIAPVELLAKYFAGECSPDELIVVEEWKSRSDDNQKEFNAFEQLWNYTGQVSARGIDIDAEWEYHQQRFFKASASSKSTFGRLLPVLKIAAVLVIISTLAVVLLNRSKHEVIRSPQYATLPVNLPDGSTLTLNADTKIRYAKGFGISHRNIELEGEGYFEVEHNSELPFKVTANGAMVEVVGTKFNINTRAADKEVKVFVTEGKVRFYARGNEGSQVLLTQYESAKFDGSIKMIEKEISSNKNDIAWKTLVIEFENTSLDDVARILNNTYQSKIVVTNPMKNCRVTASFENGTLQSVLKVLQSTLDFTIRTDGKQIVISGQGC